MGNVSTFVKIADGLKKASSVAVFCHVRPDGDAVGSACALAEGLKKLGKKADVFCSDEIPEKFFFLPEIKAFKQEINDRYDAYFAVDSADESRLGTFSGLFLSQKYSYSVDHHISNTRFAKENVVLDRASNCENVFELLGVLGVPVTKAMANLLLLGVSTDTGNFVHKNVTEHTLTVAGKLVSLGADLNRISYEMFRRQTKERAALHAAVSSKIRYELSGRVGIMTVMQNDLSSCGAKASDTEGFIDFLLSVDTVDVAVCLLEVGENRFKVSLRSKNANVNAVASTFGGGGHVLASGCMIAGLYEDVVDKLVFEISKQF